MPVRSLVAQYSRDLSRSKAAAVRGHAGSRDLEESRRIAGSFASFQTPKVRGTDHRSSGRIIEGVPAPPPHRCGAHRSVLGVRRRLVASRVGRPVGDERHCSFAGGLGFPAICGRECRSCRATRAWQAAAGMAGDDLRPGRVGVRRDDGAVYHRIVRGSVLPLYPPAAMIGFLVFPLVACVALLIFPSGYPGVARFRMLLDGAIVGASLFVVAWVTLLRDAYSDDRCESPRRVSVDRLSDRRGRDRHGGGAGACPRKRTLAPDVDRADDRSDSDCRRRRRLRVFARPPQLPLADSAWSLELAGGTGAAGHRGAQLSVGCARDVARAVRVERADLVVAALHSAGHRRRPRTRRTPRTVWDPIPRSLRRPGW